MGGNGGGEEPAGDRHGEGGRWSWAEKGQDLWLLTLPAPGLHVFHRRVEEVGREGRDVSSSCMRHLGQKGQGTADGFHRSSGVGA